MKINGICLLVVLLLLIPSAVAMEEEDTKTRELPPTFCWCNIDGIEYTTPIKNQEPAPLCEAYALCAALETIVQYQVGMPFNCDLSEAHLFFYAGGTCDWGVELTDAANYLLEYGVPDEGCFPDPHRPEDGPFESLPGWENRTVKIQEWGWVDNDITSIKQALIDHGPLVVCILQRLDFLVYWGGIYTPGLGRIRNGHVVTIVGYDDLQECWIFRNSGGTAWGEEGYARVSYYAHSEDCPFIWPFYGGTGIMYIDGAYGNLNPDVPQVYIESPQRQHTYLFGRQLPTLFKKIPFIQRGIPRIIGDQTVRINANNTEYVEFYIDGELQCTDMQAPFEWDLESPRGFHTLEIFGYKDANASKALLDFYKIF